MKICGLILWILAASISGVCFAQSASLPSGQTMGNVSNQGSNGAALGSGNMSGPMSGYNEENRATAGSIADNNAT